MGTQIIVTGSITSIESAVDVVFLWGEVQRLKITAKRMENEFEKELHEFMERENIREIDIDDERKIVRAKKVKARFDTEAIYKATGITPEQEAVLPANPAWRKTAILANDKTESAFYEEEFEEIEIREINTKYIKQKQFEKQLSERAA
jgi:hypothetical protein